MIDLAFFVLSFYHREWFPVVGVVSKRRGAILRQKRHYESITSSVGKAESMQCCAKQYRERDERIRLNWRLVLCESLLHHHTLCPPHFVLLSQSITQLPIALET